MPWQANFKVCVAEPDLELLILLQSAGSQVCASTSACC